MTHYSCSNNIYLWSFDIFESGDRAWEYNTIWWCVFEYPCTSTHFTSQFLLLSLAFISVFLSPNLFPQGVVATILKQASNQGLRFMFFNKYKDIATDNGKSSLSPLGTLIHTVCINLSLYALLHTLHSCVLLYLQMTVHKTLCCLMKSKNKWIEFNIHVISYVYVHVI